MSEEKPKEPLKLQKITEWEQFYPHKIENFGA